MTVMSRSPKTTMAAVRGMGVAVMTSRSGSLPRPSVAPALVAQGGPLLDAEAVLLVDDHHAQRVEHHPVGQQGVGADEEVDGAAGQPLVHGRALGRTGAAGEQGDPQRALAGQGRRVRDRRAPRPGAGPRRRAARPAPRSAPSVRPGSRPRRPSGAPPRPPPSCRTRRRPAAAGAWAAGRRGRPPGRPRPGSGRRSGGTAGGRRTAPPASDPSGREVTWAMPRASSWSRWRRSTSASCRRNSSSKASRRRAGSTSPMARGRWIPANAAVRSRSRSRRRTAVLHGSANGPARSRASCTRRPMRAEVSDGLLGQRVHGVDPPGRRSVVVGGGLVRAPQDLDGRAHHLQVTPERGDRSEEQGQGAGRQLARPPRLVEEDHPEPVHRRRRCRAAPGPAPAGPARPGPAGR